MKLPLTNEEGEARVAARKGLPHQRRSGRPDRAEKLISDAAMKAAWRRFWLKRGLDLPSTTTAGVIR